MRYAHPKHGYHVVSYGDDLRALEAAGWRQDQVKETQHEVQAEKEPEAAQEVKPRRGRPRKAV